MIIASLKVTGWRIILWLEHIWNESDVIHFGFLEKWDNDWNCVALILVYFFKFRSLSPLHSAAQMLSTISEQHHSLLSAVEMCYTSQLLSE